MSEFGLPAKGLRTSEMGTTQSMPHEKHIIRKSSLGDWLRGNVNSTGVPHAVHKQPPVSGRRDVIGVAGIACC